MIINELANICHQIKTLELEYQLPPHNGELSATSIVDKQSREENIARNLYLLVKRYSLGEQQ